MCNHLLHHVLFLACILAITACSSSAHRPPEEGQGGSAAATSGGDGGTGGMTAATTGNGGGGGTEPEIPILHLTFEGPPPHDVTMGEVGASLFCFGLEATGADMTVTLPSMQIEATDGGLLVTNTPSSVVFEFPYVTEGDQVIIDPVKRGIVAPWTTASLDNLQGNPIAVSVNTPRHLCVRADIVAWSLTPEDFLDKSYMVRMFDWQTEYATVNATGETLPREQIDAPTEVVGNAVTVVSNGPLEAVYTGNLTASPGGTMPPAKLVAPGKQQVPVFTFMLEAEGNGVCVRGADITRGGISPEQDITVLTLWNDTLGLAVYTTTSTSNNTATFGWHDFGILFCLAGGEQHSFTLKVDFADVLTLNSTYHFSITDATAIDRVNGTVLGSFPISGNTFMASP